MENHGSEEGVVSSEASPLEISPGRYLSNRGWHWSDISGVSRAPSSQSINKPVNNILGISMDFKITRDVRNEVLKRRELEFVLTFEGPTPSRKSIQEKLAALQNKNENLIVLDLERTRFGKMELVGRARIYDDEETKISTERKYLLKRGEAKAESEA